MTEILFADDHELMRMGLRILLEAEPDWHVCAEATNGADAVSLAQRFQPAIAILDLNMPEMGGLEAARRIREVSPETEVLIFTGFDSGELPQQVLSVGARGYVLKSAMATQVISAVRAIARERGLRLEATPPRRIDTPPPIPRAERPRVLTTREEEIAKLLAEGKSNWCVAQILGISVKTVETHRANIMKKLELGSIVELVHYAVKHRLVAVT